MLLQSQARLHLSSYPPFHTKPGQSLLIRPLTVLTGPNHTGKSRLIRALLSTLRAGQSFQDSDDTGQTEGVNLEQETTGIPDAYRAAPLFLPSVRPPQEGYAADLPPFPTDADTPYHLCLASAIRNLSAEQHKRLDRMLADLQIGGLRHVWTQLRQETLDILLGHTHRSESSLPLLHSGMGVSHALPILTGLVSAEPHHLLIMEHPEIGLHPRSVVALSHMLMDAVNSGQWLVIKTCNPLFLQVLQTRVAIEIEPDSVSLNWISSSPDSPDTSHIHEAAMLKNGSWQDGWPCDFQTVAQHTQRSYLEAYDTHYRTTYRLTGY